MATQSTHAPQQSQGYGHASTQCPPPSPPVTPEARSRLERVFDEKSGGRSHLSGVEAAAVFLQSGLDRAKLSRVQERADVHQDGRFNVDEFVDVMWMIELQTMSPVIPLEHPEAMVMSKAMTCRGCEVGILPGDVILHCDKCNNSKVSYCEPCYTPSKACEHGLKRIKLEEHDKLPIRDKGGGLGRRLKCDECKTKMNKGEICFKCDSCWNPDLCADCWRQPHKRCKHASMGSVEMRKVGRKNSDGRTGGLLDSIFSVFTG